MDCTYRFAHMRMNCTWSAVEVAGGQTWRLQRWLAGVWRSISWRAASSRTPRRRTGSRTTSGAGVSLFSFECVNFYLSFLICEVLVSHTGCALGVCSPFEHPHMGVKLPLFSHPIFGHTKPKLVSKSSRISPHASWKGVRSRLHGVGNVPGKKFPKLNNAKNEP